MYSFVYFLGLSALLMCNLVMSQSDLDKLQGMEYVDQSKQTPAKKFIRIENRNL